MIDLKAKYLDWLCDKVEATKGEPGYRFLMVELHKREFYYVLDRDENRAKDGVALRDEFLFETGHDGMVYQRAMEVLEGPCSMLEFLVGLAERMAYELYSSAYGYNVAGCFWDLIENCDLEAYRDDNINAAWFNEANLDKVCDNICARKFDEFGKGSPFPIWPPASQYANERLSGYGLDEVEDVGERIYQAYGWRPPDMRKTEFYIMMEWYLMMNYYGYDEDLADSEER